jgi:hypothetical protein
MKRFASESEYDADRPWKGEEGDGDEEVCVRKQPLVLASNVVYEALSY